MLLLNVPSNEILRRRGTVYNTSSSAPRLFSSSQGAVTNLSLRSGYSCSVPPLGADMIGRSQQQTVFSGAQRPFSDVLSSNKRGPLCSDPEGWGPISSVRYDFTPCFLDVWIVLVVAWGLFGGAGALWFLFKRRVPQPVDKNWHFYAKLVDGRRIL
jgi:hypothetical protein